MSTWYFSHSRSVLTQPCHEKHFENLGPPRRHWTWLDLTLNIRWTPTPTPTPTSTLTSMTLDTAWSDPRNEVIWRYLNANTSSWHNHKYQYISSHDQKTKDKWDLVPKSNEPIRMQNQIDRRSQFKGSMWCTHGRANALEKKCNMEVILPAYLASLALIVRCGGNPDLKGGCVARIIDPI